ncbi:MAG TPA: hypothetical protein VFE50_07635 [Cyclobacteriaceae bacterium]|nr:hypothetical protein [Cyclobacteriaceae bacterium]
MIAEIKRSWVVYLGYTVLVLLYTNRALFLGHERPLAMWLVVAAIEIYLLIGFAHVLINRSYIRIEEEKITIFRDYFKKTLISREALHAIELSENPFSRDYFVLKDGRKIPFGYYQMPKNQFEKLKATLNVPVI